MNYVHSLPGSSSNIDVHGLNERFDFLKATFTHKLTCLRPGASACFVTHIMASASSSAQPSQKPSCVFCQRTDKLNNAPDTINKHFSSPVQCCVTCRFAHDKASKAGSKVMVTTSRVRHPGHNRRFGRGVYAISDFKGNPSLYHEEMEKGTTPLETCS